MRDAARIAVGIVLSAALLGVLVVAIGPDQIADALRSANPWLYALAFPVAVATLLVWATVSATLFDVVGGDLPAVAFYETYLSGVFAKAVLPGGTVGGVGVITYVLSRRSELAFERLLAALSASEFANNAAAASVASAGLLYVFLDPAVGAPGRGAAMAVGAAAIGVVALGLLVAYALFVRFGTAQDLIRTIAGGLRATLGRVSDRAATLLAPEAVDRRLDAFSETIETVRTDRASLARAVALSHLGWLLYVTPLYLSLWAVGARVEYPVVLLVVPVAGLAAVVSTPGGLGAVDGAIAGLLLLLTGHAAGPIGAATLLYRVSTYGLTVLLTGSIVIHASVTSRIDLIDSLWREDESRPASEHRSRGGD